MNYTFPRTSWQDPRNPVEGPSFEWSDVTQVVLHYTAAVNLPDGGEPGEDQADIAPYLRNIQRWYTTPKSQGGRGYSIGYNAAVDAWGGSWELRGDTYESAATAGVNGHSFAILLLVDGDDEARAAMINTVRRLITEARQHAGRHLRIVGHNHPDPRFHSGSTTVTSCPGKGIRRQLAAGVFEPVQPEPEPTPKPEPGPTPIPQPIGATDVLCVAKIKGDGPWYMSLGPRAGAYHVPTELPAELIVMGAYDVGSKRRVTAWSQCTPTTKAAALAVLGPER